MVTLNLTEEDVKKIMIGLGELPFKMSYQTIARIEMQVKEQSNKDNIDQQ